MHAIVYIVAREETNKNIYYLYIYTHFDCKFRINIEWHLDVFKTF